MNIESTGVTVDLNELTSVRVSDPDAIRRAWSRRVRRSTITTDGRLFLVAADHTARGMFAASGDPIAMANRQELLERLVLALSVPGVDGVLGSADILDDLALLGVLDDKVVAGTMNRGGLMGASWELDDRFTAYDAKHIVEYGLDFGKMLIRIEDTDPGVARTLEACAHAVQELADQKVPTMVEPLPYQLIDGKAALLRDDVALLRAVTVAAGLASSSAYSWLKVPAWSDVRLMAQATSQPMLLLGGDPGAEIEAAFDAWARALAEPTVRGLTVGRAMLYPPDGDVAAVVARAARLVRPDMKD